MSNTASGSLWELGGALGLASGWLMQLAGWLRAWLAAGWLAGRPRGPRELR
jgi:hypothetical protein